MAMENDGEPNIFVSMTEKGLDTSQVYEGVNIVPVALFCLSIISWLL